MFLDVHIVKNGRIKLFSKNINTAKLGKIANFRGPKKKLRYNHNSLYKGGNMFKIIYGLGCGNKFVICIHVHYIQVLLVY
jgi:hypothetical protein